MDRGEIRSKLRELLAIVDDEMAERDDIAEHSRVQEDLGLDSLQIAELLFKIDDTFGAKIEDEEAWEIRTVGDLITMIEAKRGGRSGGAE